jgi:hypothetical protein
MKKLILSCSVAGLLSGCVVAPAGPPPGVVVPAGVVYVAPDYAAPAPGYVWVHHARYGWGWHHPQYGWHRGW